MVSRYEQAEVAALVEARHPAPYQTPMWEYCVKVCDKIAEHTGFGKASDTVPSSLDKRQLLVVPEKGHILIFNAGELQPTLQSAIKEAGITCTTDAESGRSGLTPRENVLIVTVTNEADLRAFGVAMHKAVGCADAGRSMGAAIDAVNSRHDSQQQQPRGEPRGGSGFEQKK